MSAKKRPGEDGGVHAMVLSGSGSSSTACFEIGAMKALMDHGCAHLDGARLDPAIYSGSAFGAFNAAVMASQVGGDTVSTLDYLENAWLEDLSSSSGGGGNGVYRLRGNPFRLLDPRSYFPQPTRPLMDAVGDFVFLSEDMVKRLSTFLGGDGPLLERLLKIPDMTALFDMAPLQRQLRKHIQLNRLRGSDKELVVMATDWAGGEARAFTKDDMTDQQGHAILQASATFLLAFPFVEIDGRPFGGAPGTMATPVKPVIELYGGGHHLTIHVVFLQPPLRDVPVTEMSSALAGLGRSFSMNEVVNIHGSVAYGTEGEKRPVSEEPASLTIHRYRPSKALINWFEFASFDREKMEEQIEAGFQDTLQHDCEAEGCSLSPS